MKVGELKIKGFSDHEISRALSIPYGTVYFFKRTYQRLEGGQWQQVAGQLTAQALVAASNQRRKHLWAIAQDKDAERTDKVSALQAIRREDEHVIVRLQELGLLPKEPERVEIQGKYIVEVEHRAAPIESVAGTPLQVERQSNGETIPGSNGV